MGAKLENNKRNIERANEIQNEGIKKGQDDVRQVSEVKSILEGMPDLLDEDILGAIENTRDSAKSEGASHMQSEVHSFIETGYAQANEAIGEAVELAQNSRQASDLFRSISGVSEFGRGAADSSAGASDSIANEFESGAEMAKNVMEETEREFQSELNDILS